MRINKLLSNYGYCSRKEANTYIEEGRILINGLPATLGQWVEESHEITLDGKQVTKKNPIFLLLNKPPGITCTRDQEVKDNIISYLGLEEYLFPVGRLDKDSQGLILLTNDGDLSNGILESEYGHEKQYQVTVDKELEEDFLGHLSQGVDIKIGRTRPCKVKKVSDHSFDITLTQGMNRQIRRMCRVFGYTITRLERRRIMNLHLNDLELGSWRYLSQEEISGLKAIINSKKEESAAAE